MASKILGTIDVSKYEVSPDTSYLTGVVRFPEEYDEFGQGYWKNLSLYNASGDASDTQYREAKKCIPTTHAMRCPGIQKLLSENFKFENLKMVRARSLLDGMVIPHKDFVELDRSSSYFRVFVPLEDNPESFHSDEAGVFQMKAGEVWFLDAGINHAAINFGGGSRMFLCLGYIFKGEFSREDIFNPDATIGAARQSFHVRRTPLRAEAIETIISATSKILNQHTFKDMVFALSKYHFIYDLPVTACYDWLITAAEATKNNLLVCKAKSLRSYLTESRGIGERYIINDWRP